MMTGVLDLGACQSVDWTTPLLTAKKIDWHVAMGKKGETMWVR